jgi:deoxyribose-phosphate aldolase
MPSYSDFSKMIDHALLKPVLTTAELERGCELAASYDVASVCTMPYFLPRAAELLRETSVLATTTIGFPHGGHTTKTKLEEAREALDSGAAELDMLVNVSQVKSGAFDFVRDEIEKLTELTHAHGKKLKVIFENCYLEDSEKITLCRICGEIGVDWVKTSTGFGTRGATIEDVVLMRKHSPPNVQVKASGGVQSFAELRRFREAGASRCGASATPVILDEVRTRLAAGEVL